MKRLSKILTMIIFLPLIFIFAACEKPKIEEVDLLKELTGIINFTQSIPTEFDYAVKLNEEDTVSLSLKIFEFDGGKTVVEKVYVAEDENLTLYFIGNYRCLSSLGIEVVTPIKNMTNITGIFQSSYLTLLETLTNKAMKKADITVQEEETTKKYVVTAENIGLKTFYGTDTPTELYGVETGTVTIEVWTDKETGLYTKFQISLKNTRGPIFETIQTAQLAARGNQVDTSIPEEVLSAIEEFKTTNGK